MTGVACRLFLVVLLALTVLNGIHAVVQRDGRSGYNNYSLQDQLLLCQLAESILPLGGNIGEQVAVKYNASRTRNSPERDVDSLKRKFKSLHAKPKPTGQGEFPLRLRPVVWAQEIMTKIEEACGVQTSHDGQDGGEDDETLQSVVDDVLGDDEPPRQSRSTATNVGSRQGSETDVGGARSRLDSQDAASASETQQIDRDSDSESISIARTSTPDAISQYAQRTGPSTPASQGAILTSSGVIDVRLASHYSFSDDDEAPEEDAQPDEEEAQPIPLLFSQLPGSSSETPIPMSSENVGATSARPSSSDASRTQNLARGSRRNPQPPLPPTPRTSTTPSRTVGRPPRQAVQHIATVATPNGPVLRRNPERAAADDREEKENRALNVASNRLTCVFCWTMWTR
jgi:hypothetical protein